MVKAYIACLIAAISLPPSHADAVALCILFIIILFTSLQSSDVIILPLLMFLLFLVITATNSSNTIASAASLEFSSYSLQHNLLDNASLP